jgi:flavorubredoxin
MEIFLKEAKTLFTNDGFGQHIATSKRYDFVGVVLSRMQLNIMQIYSCLYIWRFSVILGFCMSMEYNLDR